MGGALALRMDSADDGRNDFLMSVIKGTHSPEVMANTQTNTKQLQYGTKFRPNNIDLRYCPYRLGSMERLAWVQGFARALRENEG